MSLHVKLNDETSKALAGFTAELTGSQIQNTAGKAASNLTKARFAVLEEERPNKMGWPRVHFWANASRATSWQPSGTEGIVVAVSAIGVGLQYHGGTVKPVGINPRTGKPIQYLTIPAVAAAYGHTAGDFNNLVVKFGKGRKPIALQEAARTEVSFGKRRKDGTIPVTRGKSVGGRVFFWLVKSVTLKGDKSIIPTPDQYSIAIRVALNSQLNLVRARRAAGEN